MLAAFAGANRTAFSAILTVVTLSVRLVACLLGGARIGNAKRRA